MREISQEVLALLEQYGTNYKQALKENRKLEYLYALAEMRENLLEWYDFKKDAKLLQVGADYGALTGLYSRQVKQVTVLDSSKEAILVAKARYKEASNIVYEEGELCDHKTASYDYVILAGSLQKSYSEQIEQAKRILNPGGILIVAACNKLGMKYWAGANRDEVSVTKRQLEKCLEGGTWYYPMPDYRLPSVIYSESYLPKKGDLTDALAVYDYPKYLLMDVGAAYDMVCEDAQFENFANSFLVIWGKGE